MKSFSDYNLLFKIMLPLAATSLFFSCSDKTERNDHIRSSMSEQSETYVDTMHLKLSEFRSQVVCNGRLRALAKSELRFKQQGVVDQIFVKEGQRVEKGQPIASLVAHERERELQRAENELERSRVSLVDKLIGLGYDAEMNDVPEDVMKRAQVTSGYYTANYDLQTAQRALEECTLNAPFAGRIASLEARIQQQSDKVCTLIDDSQFDVEFKVLEAELQSVSVGDPVLVSPFINDTVQIRGSVYSINPLVDDKGLVKVTARIAGGKNNMVDGLNMRVTVEQQIQHMFVVPKDAVLERDGYYVVFLLRDGAAVWTYVDVIHSNISSFAITGCKRKGTKLAENDVVIVSGNLNLADGTKVSVSRNR